MPQVFDSVAIRIDGPRAWDTALRICWEITDTGSTYLTELRHGALNHRSVSAPPAGCSVITMTRPTLIGLMTRAIALDAALADGSVTVDGDLDDLVRLVGLLSRVDPDFAIVTP